MWISINALRTLLFSLVWFEVVIALKEGDCLDAISLSFLENSEEEEAEENKVLEFVVEIIGIKKVAD